MIRIIVVDDEILARLGIRTFLETQKNMHVIEEFSNAPDALDYLRLHGEIDIVITDIEMANKNGISFIQDIRRDKLAKGVIIVSCHDSFQYAREAISAGADAYLLKQDISQDELVSAVEEVYSKRQSEEKPDNRSINITVQEEAMQPANYAVGVVQFHRNGVTSFEESLLNGSMLDHLLENIVKRHGIGTLFVPYKSDMFILFQFDLQETEKSRKTKIENFVTDLSENIRNYTNNEVILGVSEFFQNTNKIRQAYDNAMEAASLSFYGEKKTLNYFEDINNKGMPVLKFDSDSFLDGSGEDKFMETMDRFLEECRIQQQPVEAVKETLENNVSLFIWRVLQEYRFPEKLQQKWNKRFSCRNVIESAENLDDMRNGLMKFIKDFQLELLLQLKQDELQNVIQYINNHLEEKISLQDLADMSCMSITTFCRKFKDKTGMTLVQYINQQKIEEVKHLLHRNLTLEEIAEDVGFSNVNYMIRVFRKTDGRTITEYRKACLEEAFQEDSDLKKDSKS